MHHLLDDMLEITQAAGQTVLSFYRAAYDVTDKAPDNPVTDADFASDHLLKQRLMTLLPQAGWLSEETADDSARLGKRYLWCVDPLDGTKEFILGIPEFTISVALVEDSAPILAAIYNPVTRELYSAVRGQGFFYNGEHAQTSDRHELAGAQVDASRSERKKGEFTPFENLVNLRTIGSVAYKLARVAAGQCDATWSRGPKHEWDICAGVLLVEEAGGVVVDLDGVPCLFNKPFPKVNGIIASNGPLHAPLMALLRQHGAARKEAGFTYRS